MTGEIDATLALLPDSPGVYLFKDARGAVLYVGKAQSLRNRVRSYFHRRAPGDQQPRLPFMIEQVAAVDWTITDTVSEALLLEASLVKRHQPRFNVRLKDDKSYPFIRVTLTDDYPRIERTRRIVQDGSRYFGPYASAGSVDAAMELIRRLFPFRTCTIQIREGQRALARPCLLYDMGRCQGPCIQAIDRASYRRDIAQVMLFLEGRQEAVARRLRREMAAASEALDFERAGALRDQLRAVERTMESQKMAAFARTEEDVLGLARAGAEAAVQLFVIRSGRMVGRDIFTMINGGETSDAEVLAAFVEQYYSRSRSIPPVILVPETPAGAPALQEMLAGLRGRGVAFRVPRRGSKRDLVALARRNAAEALAREQARRLADEGNALVALEELADVLGLPGAPSRIECYDISTTQGSDSAGSLVTFQDGRPYQAGYRRFRVRTVEGSDDYASHREVLRRRFERARADNDAEALRWRLPDLVVIDGGRGQVAAAAGVLEQLGLHDLPLVGLAKEREEVFVPGTGEPIVLPPTSSALYLLQRLRDEAHRFALGYHRSLRGTRQTRSALDGIAGVGPARRRALLRAFGSVKALRAAPVEAVAAVPGIGPGLAVRIVRAVGGGEAPPRVEPSSLL